jgi:hypothetical protein
MKNKRAQGISMNTIIIAAIALLVLVIVSVIFMSRMGWFTKNANDCNKLTAGKGECDHGSTCERGYMPHPSGGLCYDGNEIDQYNICCVRSIE